MTKRCWSSPLTVSKEETLFLVEVHQAGLFTIEGFEEEEKQYLLGSQCMNDPVSLFARSHFRPVGARRFSAGAVVAGQLRRALSAALAAADG